MVPYPTNIGILQACFKGKHLKFKYNVLKIEILENLTKRLFHVFKDFIYATINY